jgi:hypothetical protein
MEHKSEERTTTGIAYMSDEVAELGRGLDFIDYLDLETNYRKKTVAE